MITTVYKTNSLVESALNLKYHVIIPTDEFNLRFLFIPYSNMKRSIKIKFVSYNGALEKPSAGNWGNATFVLDRETQVGNDTIYEYTYTTSSGAVATGTAAYPNGTVSVPATCTKLMIEDVQGVVFFRTVFTPIGLCSVENAILHVNKMPIPRPDLPPESGTYAFNGIICNSINIQDKKAFHLSDIEDVIPYYNFIELSGCSNLQCNIVDICNLVNMEVPYKPGKSSEYSGLRIDVRNTKVYGTLSEAFEALAARRWKWGCQIGFDGSAIKNDVTSTTDASSCMCDENGILTHFNRVADLYANIPDE